MEQLQHAFRTDDTARFTELLQSHPELKGRLDEPSGSFDSPFMSRVRSRSMLDALLAAGADINAKSRWWAGGFGLLHGAEPELARYAISQGALVDIHAAARLGMLEEVQRLISADPTLVHARGGDGQTPLHFASTRPIAEFLLSHGAEINARDVDHESTPAQYMVRERQEIARYLVDRGARTDLLLLTALGDLERVKESLRIHPTSISLTVSERCFPKQNPHSGGTIYTWTLGSYKTALEIAQEFGRTDIYHFLVERSPMSLRLAHACRNGDEAAVQALLATHAGAAQSLPEEDSERVVHAAQDNNSNGVRLMLSAGWPVDARGQHRGTALHWAGFHGNATMTEIILRHQPPLELTDEDFKATPLGWAIYGSIHGWHCRTGDYRTTVELLLRAGAVPPQEPGGSEAVQEVLSRRGAR
jgi:ankyrin repeat protein